MRTLSRLSFVFSLLIATFLISNCKSTRQDDESIKREILSIWASGYREAGNALKSAENWQGLPEVLQAGSKGLNATIDQLQQIEANGFTIEGRLIESLQLLSKNFQNASLLLSEGDYNEAGQSLDSIINHFDRGTPEKPEALRSLMYKTAEDLDQGATALLAYGDEDVVALVDRLLEITKDEYMELAQEAIRLEDEEFRVWYGLDSPEASEGIGLLQSGEGYEQLTIALATNSRMAMKNAIEVTVLENMNLFGNNLIRIADGIGGAPILFFITIWDDECSPEGAKQGCAIENVNITYCGHSPDSVKKMLSFAKKLPFGGVAIAAATLITRLNYPVSIYVKCKFDDCMDTPCLPLVGTELEWVEQENWVEIKNDNIDTGGVGDCWLPQNWNGRTRMLFRQHMIKVLQQECGC